MVEGDGAQAKDCHVAYSHAYILIHQLMSGSGMAQQSDIEIAANHAAERRGVFDEALGGRNVSGGLSCESGLWSVKGTALNFSSTERSWGRCPVSPYQISAQSSPLIYRKRRIL